MCLLEATSYEGDDALSGYGARPIGFAVFGGGGNHRARLVPLSSVSPNLVFEPLEMEV